MPHKLTRIFVTGAAGYLGSAIAARLARPGHDVFGLTRNPEHANALRSVMKAAATREDKRVVVDILD